MTKAIKAISLAVVLLTVTCMMISCSRGTPPAAEEVDLGEVGTWNWAMSIGGIAGDTVYADSVDYTRQLIFDADSNYVYLPDGMIQSDGRYLIVREPLPGTGEMAWVIKYSDEQVPSQIVERLDADTLVLSPLTVVDAYTDYFARMIVR
ncbi:MAG: hypothetical protein KAW46_02760 [candidate division Zixibacteria bacterium]|nr:hypothetical protein [candidate division Zixibacteria bacterium]